MSSATSTLQKALFERLALHPERQALAFQDGKGSFRWRTWSQLFRDAGAYASGLRDRGLRAGDRCVIVLPSEEPCALLLLGALLLGATPLLVAPATVQGVRTDLLEVLRHVIKKVRPKIVVVAADMALWEQELATIRRGTRILMGPESVVGEPGVPDYSEPGETAALQLTSGTTGVPRICIWHHTGVLASLAAMVPAMQLEEQDMCLNWTPLYHDMGLVNNFLLCLTKGVPLVLLSPAEFVKRPAVWIQSLSRSGATVSWSPNFGFALAAQRALDAELEDVRLDHVKAIWNAAERIHYETILDFQARFAPYGLRSDAVRTNFGCAENVGGATFSDPAGPFVAELVEERTLYESRVARPIDEREARGAVWIVSAGRPSPGIRLEILSRTGKPLPDGHVGEVALETPSRMVGYLGDAKATSRALYREFLRTGDLAYKRGQEMFWVGRVRERITAYGKKLDPSDFERVLLHVEDLRAGCFAVFGVDDRGRGTQRIVLVSELRQPMTRPAAEVDAKIREQVSLHLGVRLDDLLLVPTGTLTKTSSGKRRHRHFRRQYLEGALQPLAIH